MKWYAGFETAFIHWNGNCMADYTGHQPDQRMRANYDWAQREGFCGARDSLAWRLPSGRAWHVPPSSEFHTVWSLHHYGPAYHTPYLHARGVLDLLQRVDANHKPWILPVVEPSVGHAVSGLHPHEAEALFREYLNELQGQAVILTGDPVHQLAEWEWAMTDRLVATGAVDVVGVHCYAHHLCVPLNEVIRAAKDRYGLPVVLGETGLHEGHPGNEGRPHECRTRHEWFRYVEREAGEAGAMWAAWMPALPINWEGGEPWPSGWPEGALKPETV